MPVSLAPAAATDGAIILAGFSSTRSRWSELFGWSSSGRSDGLVDYRPHVQKEGPKRDKYLSPKNVGRRVRGGGMIAIQKSHRAFETKQTNMDRKI